MVPSGAAILPCANQSVRKLWRISPWKEGISFNERTFVLRMNPLLHNYGLHMFPRHCDAFNSSLLPDTESLPSACTQRHVCKLTIPVTAIVLARSPFSLPGQFDPRCFNPCAIFRAELLDQGSHPFSVVRPKNRRLLRQSIKCSHDRLNFEHLPAKHGERTSQQVCV